MLNEWWIPDLSPKWVTCATWSFGFLVEDLDLEGLHAALEALLVPLDGREPLGLLLVHLQEAAVDLLLAGPRWADRWGGLLRRRWRPPEEVRRCLLDDAARLGASAPPQYT